MTATDPSPATDLIDALRQLREVAGWPSTRDIAGRAGISHAMVSDVLRGKQVGSWRLMAKIIDALEGSPNDYVDLWRQAAEVSRSERLRLGPVQERPKIVVRKARSDYCCEVMREELKQSCEVHPDPFECPDLLVTRSSGEYGLIIHDSGNSYIVINYCPWCGTRL